MTKWYHLACSADRPQTFWLFSQTCTRARLLHTTLTAPRSAMLPPLLFVLCVLEDERFVSSGYTET